MNQFESSMPQDCWEIVGIHRGPSVVIIGGTHGDETTGIEVVRSFLALFDLISKPSGTYMSSDILGKITLIFGNPKAIQMHKRGVSSRDLNRSFIKEDLVRLPNENDSEDLKRARELAPILAHAQFVIDLHGTSSDSPPFVCFGNDSERHRELYRLLPVNYILTDPNNILSQEEQTSSRGTTDDYVEQYGGVAIGYETGREDDLSKIGDVIHDVIRLLQKIVSISPECSIKQLIEEKTIAQQEQAVYALTHSVLAHSSSFTYSQEMDRGWQRVSAGQLIGIYADGTEERAPESGMMIFPKAIKKIEKEKSLYFIAKEII